MGKGTLLNRNRSNANDAMAKGYKIFRWTGAHRALILANLDKTDAQIAAMIGVGIRRLEAFRKRQGINKASNGAFKKGFVPHNKGKEAPWARTKCTKGQFKRGGRPHNANPIGSLLVEKNHGKKRMMICVEGSRAVPYARWLWEKHQGKAPKGYVVRIVNGVWDDIRLDNLVCVSRADNSRMNSERIPKDKRREMGLSAWKARRLNDAKKASERYEIAA